MLEPSQALAAIETCSVPMCSFNAEGRILTANRACRELFSLPPLLDETVILLSNMLNGCKNLPSIPGTLDEWGHWEGEIGFRTEDDRDVYFQATFNKIPGDSVGERRFFGVLCDITDRRMLAEAMENFYNTFNRVLDSFEAIVYVADMKTHEILYANRHARQIFGEVNEKPCHVWVQGSATPCDFCNNSQLVDGDGNAVGMIQQQHKNQSNGNWYEVIDRAIPWIDGRLVRMEIAVDITESKRVHTELIEERKKREEILYRIVPSAIFTVGLDRRITSWSIEAERITGYSAAEMIGRECGTFNCGCPDCGISQPCPVPPLKEQESVIIRKDGRQCHIVKNSDFLRDADGTIIGMIESFMDITRQKEVESSLLETRRHLDAILSNMQEMILYKSCDMTIQWVNRAACEIIGVPESELVGKQCFEMCPFDGTQSACPRRAEGCLTWEQTWKHRDKTIQIYEKTLTEPDGTVSGHIVVGMDVTEKEKAKQEAEYRTRQLYQADKMASLGVLAAGVTHEINNPNNFIMLNITTLRKFLVPVIEILDRHAAQKPGLKLSSFAYPEFIRRMNLLLDGIYDGSERIRNIVSDLKDFARQEGDTRSEPVSVNDVVRVSVNLLRNLLKKSTKNLVVEYGSDLPPVHGRPQRLEQVMINLIQNACQSLPDPNRKVMVRTRHDRNSGRVLIEVEDEGKGIKREHIDRITDPFFTTKRDMGGTGLGLSVSLGIVREHGGELLIESKEGQGSLFTISLPVLSSIDAFNTEPNKHEPR